MRSAGKKQPVPGEKEMNNLFFRVPVPIAKWTFQHTQTSEKAKGTLLYALWKWKSLQFDTTQLSSFRVWPWNSLYRVPSYPFGKHFQCLSHRGQNTWISTKGNQGEWRRILKVKCSVLENDIVNFSTKTKERFGIRNVRSIPNSFHKLFF